MRTEAQGWKTGVNRETLCGVMKLHCFDGLKSRDYCHSVGTGEGYTAKHFLFGILSIFTFGSACPFPRPILGVSQGVLS